MTLHMQQRLTWWGAFEDIDLPAIGACDFKLTVSYTHAATLRWQCLEAQHTASIPGGCFIRFWIEGANDPNGDAFSESNPLFEGYVEVPEPADQSIGVNYTAYDPTFRATRMVKIFNQPWPFGNKFADPPEPPVRPANAVPQVYYNVRISNDPAWSRQVGGDGTLGQLFGGILDYTANALVWCDAAPGDGTEAGAELPYDQADLDALTVKPQEKMDFSSEAPWSAIQRCMNKNPHLTFAGIKQTHCRPDRLPAAKWEALIRELQIDEAAALAGDPPRVAMPPRPAATPSRDPTAWQHCTHRGDVIAMRKADLCGLGGKMFAVHACAIHGECVLTRFCKKQPEQACYLCPDAVAEAPPMKAVPTADVAVVIPCHNYGRFLAEAIESCLQQTTSPAEIVVIDDASDDDTAAVAARGVRYARIDARSVYRARRRGMELTTAPFLVFLDADDLLGADYLERRRALFADTRLGLAWTDLQEFGDSDRLRSYPPGDIEAGNYIHAGAMVRRVALEQSGAFTATQPTMNITADWFVWREVRRAGWTDRKFAALYRYRQHGGGCHLSGRGVSYFDYAHLAHETVPLILPLSGRDRWWDQLTKWVQRQTWPRVEIFVIDSSTDPAFHRRVRNWLAGVDCPTTYLPIAGIPGLADEDRTQRVHFRAVQQAMSRIYRHLDRTTREPQRTAGFAAAHG